MDRYIYLAHHGIKGQRWGIRRYQNPDGTLTPAGRERYYKDRVKELKKEYRNKVGNKWSESGESKYIKENYGENYKKDKKLAEDRSAKRKVIAAGAVIGTAAAAYLTIGAVDAISTYKINDKFTKNVRVNFDERFDNILNDPETMKKFEEGKKLNRVLYGNENEEQKIFNESLYVTDNDKDRKFYKAALGNMQGGFSSKKEITYEAKNDIYSAQGKDLVNYALEALGYDYDASDLNKNDKEIREAKRRVQDAIFDIPKKNRSGELVSDDAKKIRDKLIEEGYGSIKDYTDAGILGDAPRVMLNAKNDLKVKKIKEVNTVDELLSKWRQAF